MKLNLIIFFVLFSCLVSSVTGRAIDRTIAKINDDILTESDLAEIISDITGRQNSRSADAFALATSETVASMFDRALLLQEARRMKIVPEAEETHRQVEEMVREIKANFPSEKEFYQALASEHMSLDQLKTELVEKTKTDFMVFHVVNSRYSISDHELEGFKDRRAAAGEPMSSYRLRRLGVPITKKVSQEEACRQAREIVTRIITDGISFEEGVRRYSQVAGAAADGGDMGYMSADKLSDDVRAAVENLNVGQASAPVIAGGYANVFYVEGKRGARSALREKKFFDAREELLASLRHKSILQIYDDRLLKILPDIYRKTMVNSPGANTNAADATVQTPMRPGSTAANAQIVSQNQQHANTAPVESAANQSRRYIPVNQAQSTPVPAIYYYQATPTPAPTPAPQRRGIGAWLGRR